MTPKQKANQLNKLYKSYLPSSLKPDLFKALSKKFALLCIDEIIETLPDTHYTEISEHRPVYWEEVKTELSLL